MNKLIIAEKPSVAHSIAAVLGANEKKDGCYFGSGYIVSWCVGHLVELASADAYDEKYAKWRYADLPIVPKTWQYVIAKDRKKQLEILRGLMNDKDTQQVICATDAGREGELIFRLVYEKCGCTKPVKRLWISSMEDSAIQNGFANLKDGADYENLYAAALCRTKADWLVGINATRLFSVLYGATLNVGRVMSPTLALLTRREADIAAFKKEPFYIPEISCGGFTAAAAREQDKAAAEAVRLAADAQTAAVLSAEKQEKTSAPPRLYDLTSLQRDANRLLGFTAQQTLDYLQSLYEKKLATYPRTDSRFLTEDMEAAAKEIAGALTASLPFTQGISLTPDIKRVCDSSKVTDHHAIIPTMQSVKADMDALPAGERDILLLIASRLLCAVAPPHTFEAVTATLDCGGHTFTAKGKTVVKDGWKEIERAYLTALKDKPEDKSIEDEKSLPELAEGQTFEKVSASVREGQTAPPKHYTEDTLLAAMETAGAEDMPDDAERKGLGAPATRAATIEKLVGCGLAERRKKQMLPTDKGANLIAVLPDSLTSALLTAEWETKLLEVERGNMDAAAFMDGITEQTDELVKSHSAPIPEYAGLFGGGCADAGEPIGICPRCGGAVRERQKGFFCENAACTFALWKDNKFFAYKKKTITKAVATALLKDGRAAMSGLYSEKTGKTYDATVVMDSSGDKYVNFKLEFESKKK
jgi:DNA topoisomerase-3